MSYIIERTEWQGEPVKIDCGYCTVTPIADKPLFWFNYECANSETPGEAKIPALKVKCKDGDEFVISNHFGIGIHKLNRGGWPDQQHFSLPMDKFTSAGGEYIILHFDKKEFDQYELKRDEWQMKEHPEEWTRIQGLLAAAKAIKPKR